MNRRIREVLAVRRMEHRIEPVPPEVSPAASGA